MRQISWNELLTSPAELLEWIQQGNALRIYQSGKPIAELLPLSATPQPAWKHSIQRMSLSGVKLSAEILHDRDES